jgi:hypothetical protein
MRGKMGDVPSPEDYERRAEALRQVRVAKIRRDESTLVVQMAQTELTAAIINALDAGAHVTDVAEAAEVSRQWIARLRMKMRQRG